METENIKPAKTCFSHIGGKLGMLLMERFVESGWIAKRTASDKHFYITTSGLKGLEELGIDTSQIKDEPYKVH